jgi:pSer/pThr/pTyr-binding forkhead associated (FHA) protein
MSFRIVPLVNGTAPSIALFRPVILIGRHPDCDVRIDSPKVSRRHCCVAMAYDRLLIRDLGSRNGVRVNGRLLEETRLQAGDELAIGPILFRLEQEEEDIPAPRPGAARPGAISGLGKPGGVKPGQKPRGSPAPDSDVDLVPLDDL